MERQDYHYKRYKRNGICVVLMAVEPLVVNVTEQKTKKDSAVFMKALAASYPNAAKIILAHDNLNTHNPSSFYETFPATEAFALSQRFEMVYTPKKASQPQIVRVSTLGNSFGCRKAFSPDFA